MNLRIFAVKIMLVQCKFKDNTHILAVTKQCSSHLGYNFTYNLPYVNDCVGPGLRIGPLHPLSVDSVTKGGRPKVFTNCKRRLKVSKWGRSQMFAKTSLVLVETTINTI